MFSEIKTKDLLHFKNILINNSLSQKMFITKEKSTKLIGKSPESGTIESLLMLD